MSVASTVFRRLQVPTISSRLHTLLLQRSISDDTDDSIQPNCNGDLLSGQFDKLLKSNSIQSNISFLLESNGYASTTSDVESKSASNPIPILSHAKCQTLIQKTIPDLFRGHFDTGIYPDEWHWREGISRDGAAREMCNSWKSSRLVASIVLHEKIGQFIAQVMGWDSVRIAQDDIVWKTPFIDSPQPQFKHPSKKSDTVGFHQDSAYISRQFKPYKNNSVTSWIALDDSDEENGCIEYALKSHLWFPILHSPSFRKEDYETYTDRENSLSNFHNSNESSYKTNNSFEYAHSKFLEATRDPKFFENVRDEYDFDMHGFVDKNIQSVPVKVGNALLHHQDIWHGSGPNKSNSRHRRALVAHYLRGDVKFTNEDAEKPPFGKTSYIYGRYKRYKCAELDETFFPIIFSKSGATNGLKRTGWIDEYTKCT